MSTESTQSSSDDNGNDMRTIPAWMRVGARAIYGDTTCIIRYIGGVAFDTGLYVGVVADPPFGTSPFCHAQHFHHAHRLLRRQRRWYSLFSGA